MAWPTTSNPRTLIVTVRLTTDEAAELDAYASALHLSRSETMRDAVSRVIAAHNRKQKKAVQKPVQP